MTLPVSYTNSMANVCQILKPPIRWRCKCWDLFLFKFDTAEPIFEQLNSKALKFPKISICNTLLSAVQRKEALTDLIRFICQDLCHKKWIILKKITASHAWGAGKKIKIQYEDTRRKNNSKKYRNKWFKIWTLDGEIKSMKGFVILVDKSLAGSTKFLFYLSSKEKTAAQVCDIQYGSRAETTEQIKWGAFLV